MLKEIKKLGNTIILQEIKLNFGLWNPTPQNYPSLLFSNKKCLEERRKTYRTIDRWTVLLPLPLPKKEIGVIFFVQKSDFLRFFFILFYALFKRALVFEHDTLSFHLFYSRKLLFLAYFGYFAFFLLISAFFSLFLLYFGSHRISGINKERNEQGQIEAWQDCEDNRQGEKKLRSHRRDQNNIKDWEQGNQGLDWGNQP